MPIGGNNQTDPTAAIPVRLTNGAAFYAAVAGGGGGQPYASTPLGFQQITATGVQTLTVPATAIYALIQAEASDWRWRDDGVAPTATVGTLQFQGPGTVFSGDLAALKLITTNTGGILNVSYYK